MLVPPVADAQKPSAQAAIKVHATEQTPLEQRLRLLQRSIGNQSLLRERLTPTGDGRPIEPALLAKMEAQFGERLSDVRVHSSTAGSSTANAYTTGNRIVFAAGRYSPGTHSGRLLLAHELAHVLQQRRGGQGQPGVAPESPSEQEATRLANEAASGHYARVTTGTAPGPARQMAREQIMMLTDQDLAVEVAAVQTWLIDPANKASPSYAANIAYLNSLEAVVAHRNPQHAQREARQSAEGRFIRKTAGLSLSVPGVNPALIAFFAEFLMGMRERLEQLPLDRTVRALTRLDTMSLSERVEFTIAYVKGIGLGVWGEVKGVWDLIKLPFTILTWIGEQIGGLIFNWPAVSVRLQAVRDKLAKAAAKAGEEIGKFLQNPEQGLQQLDAFVDALIAGGLAKANQWGQDVVDQTLSFFEQPLEELGEKLGHVVGVIIFNVVLLVASEAIGNLIKEGAALAGRIMGWAGGKARSILLAIRSFLPKLIEIVKGLAERVLKFLAESLNLVVDALKSVDEALQGIEVAESAEGGMRIPVSLAEEAEQTGVFASSMEGNVPGRTTTTSVEELMGRSKGTGPVSRVPSETPKPRVSRFTSEEIQAEISAETDVERVSTPERFQETPLEERGARGAGASRNPRHHGMPQENRAWFERRGFQGAHSIDEFTVELDEAVHQALHGGGNWRLGRRWPGEWNRMIMRTLRQAEGAAGRRLVRDEIIEIVRNGLLEYGVDPVFVPYRG